MKGEPKTASSPWMDLLEDLELISQLLNLWRGAGQPDSRTLNPRCFANQINNWPTSKH